MRRTSGIVRSSDSMCRAQFGRFHAHYAISSRMKPVNSQFWMMSTPWLLAARA
jgi:hypothetical protein